jgi:hypothetical protein
LAGYESRVLVSISVETLDSIPVFYHPSTAKAKMPVIAPSPKAVVDVKFMVKERLLKAMSKMNDRDTAKAAAEELQYLVMVRHLAHSRHNVARA